VAGRPTGEAQGHCWLACYHPFLPAGGIGVIWLIDLIFAFLAATTIHETIVFVSDGLVAFTYFFKVIDIGGDTKGGKAGRRDGV